MKRGMENIGNVLRHSFQHWQFHLPKDNAINQLNRHQLSNTSFLPTIMTRLSPFFPVIKYQMKIETITEPIIIENPWGKIKATDRRLSIYDETVLLCLLMLLKKYDSNTFQTTPYELCNLMNMTPSKDTCKAIMKSLHRMSEAHITMEKRVSRSNDAQTEMDGSIITGITKNKESKKMIIELNSYLLSSFRNQLITPIDIRLRSELRGDISKALYRFYEGQRLNCYTISIMKLSKAINMCCDGNMYSLRLKLRKAMRELEIGGYLRRFILPHGGKVVAVFKSRNRFLNDYICDFKNGNINQEVSPDMKPCKRCFREFDEDENLEFSPARDLADIFISGISNVDVQDICPECREELGVMNLMGFRP